MISQALRTVLLAAVLVAGTLAPAHAQISITGTDLQSAFPTGPYAQQTLFAQAGETAKIQAILDAVGDGGTYDFGQVGVQASLDVGEIQRRPFDDTIPDAPDFSEAPIVDASGTTGGFPLYSFYWIDDTSDDSPDGLYEHGDLSLDPSTKTRYTPPLRVFPTPLTATTSWTSGEVTAEFFSGGTLDSTRVASRSGEVIGYGGLVLPGGDTQPALVHRFLQVDGPDTTHAVSFVTKSLRGTVTVLTDGNRNVIKIPDGLGQTAPAAFFLLESAEGATASVGASETGSFLGGPLGASVEITGGSTASGTLRGYRIDYPSFNNAINDTGTPAGFPVANVSQSGYWVLDTEGLAGFTYTVCLDYSGIPGISDATELAVGMRGSSGEAWRPQPSAVDSQAKQVCASGLTSTSEFTVMGSSSNPLPVELAGFEAQMDGDAVHLSWQTASETNNAGFEIERSQMDGPFTHVGFVPGNSTSTDVRAYRFVDAQPPFAAERLTYRLRQVDHDGAARIAGTVDVTMRLSDEVALFAPFPNPVQDRMTLRYALPTATSVEIHVYNVLGRRVATLLDRPQPAGRSELGVDGSQLATGTYFVRMIAGDQVRTRKMTVVR